MTIQQIIEDELLALDRDEKRHLSRGNWQNAAMTVIKRDTLMALKQRILKTEIAMQVCLEKTAVAATITTDQLNPRGKYTVEPAS